MIELINLRKKIFIISNLSKLNVLKRYVNKVLDLFNLLNVYIILLSK